MIDIRPFEAADLWKVELQDSQADMSLRFTREFADAILFSGTAMTAVFHGKPVAIAGLADIGGQSYAWAFMGKASRPVMLAATRACMAVLDKRDGDVLVHVRTDIPANARWLRMMGFATTGMRETMPDGRAYDVWIRTQCK